MNTIALAVLPVLTGLLAVASWCWYSTRRRPSVSAPAAFLSSSYRNLSAEEQEAVGRYLHSLQKRRPVTILPGASNSEDKLALTPQSHHVYAITSAITRYAFPTDEPYKWRYYLDEMEVHLPPQWEQYITDENRIELIKTHPVPLIISLNEHSLIREINEAAVLPATPPFTGGNASIRQEETEHIELVQVRKETMQEYALSRSGGTGEAAGICLALLLFFSSLTGPVILMPWLIAAGFTLLLICGWLLWRPPAEKSLRDVHCLRGALKRWGLFSEASPVSVSNISLGNLDLIYPPHWQPYVSYDLGQTTDVEIYLNRQVVRQGHFLSLHDEVCHFPIQRWRKNVMLAAGSLLLLILLISWVPLSMPLKLSIAWLKSSENVQVINVEQLEKTRLHVGDRLTVSGTGMCSIPTFWREKRSHMYTPFDCSAVYWNNAAPPPLPQSDIIDKATALLNSTSQQLHPQTATDPGLNPQLTGAIQKSGMILLPDFSDIVMKTQQLCSQPQDCVRLKNALVNLDNASDWDTLVRRTENGALNGINVLLRPVSASALENLVHAAVDSFFFHEIRRAAEALNTPPPDGFLILSDEGRQLVNQPVPSTPLLNYNAPGQWSELQRLAGMLLHTPFNATGIITSITEDANGTRRIAIHHEPDSVTFWRYLGTSLLLCVLLLSLAFNTLLALRRIHHNRMRLLKIQRYYDSCISQPLTTVQPIRSHF